MLTTLAVLLCITIVISAVWADRSARAKHTWRAVCLNLCGIGCLAVGLVVISAWNRGGSVVPRRVAVVDTPGNPGTLVRLLVNSDGRVERARPARRLPAGENQVDQAENAEVDSSDVVAAAEADVERADDVAAEPPEKTMPEIVERGEGLPSVMMSQVEIDFEARPEWVDREDTDVGPVHQISVASGPYLRHREARQELERQLKLVTDEYINECVGSQHGARWIGLNAEQIRQTLVGPENIYDEKVISPSFGVMHQSHALLEFGPEFHQDIEQAWHNVVARAQLVKLALVAGAVLGMLALLFGYFNADTATKGFYTGRLKFVTAVAILGLVALGIFLARSIPWLWL
jgi:hypothetical protein